MEQIQKATLVRALAMLDAIKATYCVIDPDGGEYGTLQVAKPKPEPKRVAARDGRKYGDLSRVYRPIIDPMQPGDVAKVPVGTYKANEMGASVSAYCALKWGKKASTYITSEDKQHIEVLRIV